MARLTCFCEETQLLGLSVLLGHFLGEFVRVHGVLKRLFAQFVTAQMVSLAMGNRGRGVGVCRKIVELCDSIVRTLWHGGPPRRLQVDRVPPSECEGRFRKLSTW